MLFATASWATDITVAVPWTVAVAAARTTRYAVLLVLNRPGDAGDAPPRPGVAVSFAPPDVGGGVRRRGVASRPRRVVLCGTLLLASPHRRLFCVIWHQSFFRLARRFAPCAQPARVPYGHGDLVGAPFAYRTGRMARVYLVAPALQFIQHEHGPLTTYDETQLRAYYRSIPDMQHPLPVLGSTPLGQRLGPA